VDALAIFNRRRVLGLGALAATSAVIGTVATRQAAAGNRYYDGPVSDHFDGTRFFNPNGAEPNGFGDFLRWQFGGDRARWPRVWPDTPRFAVPERRVSGDAMRVTMVGHATMLIQTAEANILTDPVWSRRASPVGFAGPARVNPPGIRFEDLPPIDLVLLTHNHYDHLDVETLARLQAAHDPLVITPLGNDAIVRRSVSAMRLHVQDWGDAFEANGVTVHCEPAHHWSARGMRDRRMALWCAFALETRAGRIYHIGDTGFHSGINYRAARAKHGGFRLAILPIGAYEPRWFMQGQHQNPVEAVEGMRLAGAEFAVGHHWGTFQLTDEALEAPLEALRAALNESEIPAPSFRPLGAGEVWDVPRSA
jgi:L-ascorbate metabolism protein UlaG (beta-lactamase superfamily)